MVSPPLPSFLKLPVPVKYEELQKEVFISLRPETFEGMRFEFVKPMNSQFMLTHSTISNIQYPLRVLVWEILGPSPVLLHHLLSVSANTFKTVFDSTDMFVKMFMVGRMTSEGRMSGRITYDVNDWMSLKWQAQLVNEPDVSQQMCDIDIKGSYFHGQLKVGSNGFFGVNYLQSVTEKLSLGGEVFYMDEQRRSGLGFAARHVGDNHIGAAQMANTGMLSLSYLQKIGDKASLAADFLYNSNMKEATTSIGYDYLFQQAHVRGKVDSNGVLSAFLEERLNPAVTFLLSGEVDHKKKDYKFGFGLHLGE